MVEVIDLQQRKNRDSTVLFLLIMTKLLLYDDFFFRDITLIIVGLRTSFLKSFWLLVVIILVTMSFAIIGHLLFHDCAFEYKDPLESFLTVYRIGMNEQNRLPSTIGSSCYPYFSVLCYLFFTLILNILLWNSVLAFMLRTVDIIR